MAFVDDNPIKQNSSFTFKGGFAVTFKADSSENRSGFRLWYRLKNIEQTTTLSVSATTRPLDDLSTGIIVNETIGDKNQSTELDPSGCNYAGTHFSVGTIVQPLCPKVKSGFVYDIVYKHVCIQGYKFEGDPLVCNESNSWNSSEAICEPTNDQIEKINIIKTKLLYTAAALGSTAVMTTLVLSGIIHQTRYFY